MPSPRCIEDQGDPQSGPPCALPTEHGDFTVRSFTIKGVTHAALTLGDPSTVSDPLVRVHSECLTGDALGSFRCDCGDQLAASFAVIAGAGAGIIVYLRDHEGRGIGLENKLRAYSLQDSGLDTVAANRALDLPDDARSYEAAAVILRGLGCERIRLLSSNPVKVSALEHLGIEIAERLDLQVEERPTNAHYLETKRRLMGHFRHRVGANGTDAEALAGSPVSVYDSIAADNEVVAQLAQSEDGFIATSTGDSTFVSGAVDRTHLHRIRSVVGAVLIGVQTAVVDDPRLTVRAVTGANPVRVVLDPHGRLPAQATVLTSGEAKTLWLVGADVDPIPNLADHVHVVRLPAGHLRIPPDRLIAIIGQHVSGAILVEGGGRTVSAFLAAGALDRLFITSAPVLIGNGVPGIRFDGTPVMAQALRTPFRRYEFADDICTEYLLSERAVERAAREDRPPRPGLSPHRRTISATTPGRVDITARIP